MKTPEDRAATPRADRGVMNTAVVDSGAGRVVFGRVPTRTGGSGSSLRIQESTPAPGREPTCWIFRDGNEMGTFGVELTAGQAEALAAALARFVGAARAAQSPRSPFMLPMAPAGAGGGDEP